MAEVIAYVQSVLSDREVVLAAVAVIAVTTLTLLGFVTATRPPKTRRGRFLSDLAFLVFCAVNIAAVVYSAKLSREDTRTFLAAFGNLFEQNFSFAVQSISVSKQCLSRVQAERLIVLVRLRDQYAQELARRGKNDKALALGIGWPPVKWINDQLATYGAEWHVVEVNHKMEMMDGPPVGPVRT